MLLVMPGDNPIGVFLQPDAKEMNSTDATSQACLRRSQTEILLPSSSHGVAGKLFVL